jgi:2-isopropylmalate synthase
VVVSELAGRSSIRAWADELGLEAAVLDAADAAGVLARVKDLEHDGAQFEAAGGSLELLVRRAAPGYRAPFELVEYGVVTSRRGDAAESAAPAVASVTLRVGDVVVRTSATGDGPVHALDRAVRQALVPAHPCLAEVRLTDYKVRIMDAHLGTAARTRVLVESRRGDAWWSTVGWGADVIEASWHALRDALELPLARQLSAAAGSAA